MTGVTNSEEGGYLKGREGGKRGVEGMAGTKGRTWHKETIARIVGPKPNVALPLLILHAE